LSGGSAAGPGSGGRVGHLDDMIDDGQKYDDGDDDLFLERVIIEKSLSKPTTTQTTPIELNVTDDIPSVFENENLTDEEIEDEEAAISGSRTFQQGREDGNIG